MNSKGKKGGKRSQSAKQGSRRSRSQRRAQGRTQPHREESRVAQGLHVRSTCSVRTPLIPQRRHHRIMERSSHIRSTRMQRHVPSARAVPSQERLFSKVKLTACADTRHNQAPHTIRSNEAASGSFQGAAVARGSSTRVPVRSSTATLGTSPRHPIAGEPPIELST